MNHNPLTSGLTAQRRIPRARETNNSSSIIDNRTMKMNPYLSFKGDCETAFKFYERSLGAQIGPIFRYGGTPLADRVPAEWSDKIMHGSLTLGDQVLMGADVAADQYEEPKGFSLALQIKSTADAERIFHELAIRGRVVVPLEKTFWAARFGVLVDRFGIPWLINCESSEQAPE
jgi:PhnB protein